MNLKLNLPTAIVIAGLAVATSIVYVNGKNSASVSEQSDSVVVNEKQKAYDALQEEVAPSAGVELPVTWLDLGKKLVELGVIDKEKMIALYTSRGEWNNEYASLILESSKDKLRITRENSGFILNLLWALGLGSKSRVLEAGDMVNPKYGGAENFASTGGWTLSKGDAMTHYSKHAFFNLTEEDEKKVERVAKGIYRPCCNNSTYFPDCNHGMAMLGLLELMASQGVSEEDMYKTALAVNSYWFTDTYIDIATLLKNNNVEWNVVNPKEVLGINFSSAAGIRQVREAVSAPNNGSGVSCGVEGSAPAGSGAVKQAPQVKQPGCGI